MEAVAMSGDSYYRPVDFGDAVARGSARDAQHEIDVLKADVDRLMMIVEGLWTLLKERDPGLHEDDLLKKVYEIDALDGHLNGRKAPTPARPCPQCGRTLVKRRPRCVYCEVIVKMDLFET